MTASGAVDVQITWSTSCGSRNIEHPGLARDDGEVEALKVANASCWPRAGLTSTPQPKVEPAGPEIGR